MSGNDRQLRPRIEGFFYLSEAFYRRVRFQRLTGRRADGNLRLERCAMALIGYARVSTQDQNPEMQDAELVEAGCSRVFVDTASGALSDRPQLAAALAFLRPDDVLCVWRLDRLGRSLKHLVQTVGDLEDQGIGFKSLRESIDTTTPTGRLVFHIFASLAEFERDLIRERTSAGLAAARARGRSGGRPPSLSPKKVELARSMHAAGDTTVAEIASVLGVSRATIYRHLQPAP